MTPLSHIATPGPRIGPDPTPGDQPTATATPPDGIGTGEPVALTAQPDKSSWLWCRGCNSAQPREGRVGFRCKACAAKAKNSPNRWLFDAQGNVISKGTKPGKAKAPAATEALKTNKEQSK